MANKLRLKPAARKPGLKKQQARSIREKIRRLCLDTRACGITYAGDIMAVNLKTLDFSTLPEFLVGSLTGGNVT